MISYERPNKSIRNISPKLLNKIAEVLGIGRFASCFKAYLQGTSVCIKGNDQLSPSKAINAVSKEANILSQLSHPGICFLIGVQAQQTPYCLVVNLYEVRGYSITVHDLLFPDSITRSRIAMTFPVLHTFLKILEHFRIILYIHIHIQ